MRTVYICDYCADTFDLPNECEEHEGQCDYNPKCRTCVICVDYQNFKGCRAELEANENVRDCDKYKEYETE